MHLEEIDLTCDLALQGAEVHDLSRFVERARLARRRHKGCRQGPVRVSNTAVVGCANITRQIDPQLENIHHSQMTVKRHHHTQAVCAVATQLAIRLHAILRRQRAYQLRDLEGRETSVAEGKFLYVKKPTVRACERDEVVA